MNVEIAKITSSLESLKRHSDQIQQEISTSQERDTDIENIELELEKMKVDLKDAEINLSKVQEEKDYVDVLREILNDKGAKAQIIRKYVPIMNALINKYLQAMDFYISFNLDEEFNEKLKSRFRDDFSYASFSEGEKQKIDLSLLFTWREVARMKNSVATNLLILDEVFDSSLDASATNELLQILKSLGQTTNLFVISHKGDVLLDKFLRTIKFEKINDFSKMSDDS